MKQENNFRLKNVIIYNSWFDAFENDLTDEQVGKFMKAIGRWKNGDELYSDDPEVRGMFIAIKKDLQDLVDSYNERVEQNRVNGRKGGRPAKVQNNPNNPIGYLETDMVLEKPNITEQNPKNLKDKDKENVITSKEVITNDSDLGGYGNFLKKFPPAKQRDIEEGKLIWDSFEQKEKAEVMRHLSSYIKKMTSEGQEQYIKNSYAYLESELWLDMKPRSFIAKPVERGMRNMSFISFYSKLKSISEEEATAFLYRTSTDKEFSQALKLYQIEKDKLFQTKN